MTTWSVHLEVISDQAVATADLLDKLNDAGISSASFDQREPGRMGVTVTVDADGAEQAIADGVALFTRAMELPFGYSSTTIVAAEAITADELDHRLAAPPVQLAGPQELAHKLGISRQRLYELMKRPDFPHPIAELAIGPIWNVESVNHFVTGWNRKGGRPRKAPTELLQDAIAGGADPKTLFPRKP